MASSVVFKIDTLIHTIQDIPSSNAKCKESEIPENIKQHRVIIGEPEDNKSDDNKSDDYKNSENKNDKILSKSKQDAPRITELPNEMSWNIDISSPKEILRILRVCDSQIFNGWHEFSNIYDFIPIINIIIRHLFEILSDTKNNRVILSGSGTSGRLGWVLCRAFNKYLIKNGYFGCFDYCLSGYDKALLTSQELYEDDPKCAVKDLLNCTQNAKKVLLIGITCGLSAPYVGGQIEYAMKQSNFITVLMGFNPAHLSRNRSVEKWNGKTFRDICLKLNEYTPKPNDFYNDIDDENNKYFKKLPNKILLNPIFGPETITGSTRMKSGSGTKILLDIIFILGCYQIHKKNDKKKISNKELNELIFDYLSEYENIYRQSYSYKYSNKLSKICKLCGNSLKTNNGKVLYYGGCDATTIVSFIDASEMKPTYGTILKRYRSYFEGGWKFLENKQGDLSHIDQRFKVEPKYLNISSLTKDDLIIFIGNVKTPKIDNAKCKFARISVGGQGGIDDFNSIYMKINFMTRLRKLIETNCNKLLSTFDDFCNMFAMKLLLNAVSTSGHVLSGTVLHNRMINVRVSNDKLFYRSIGMIQEFGKVNFEIGKQCLLISIYGKDKYKEKENEPVSSHLIAARDVNKIVPVAILLASQISQGIKQTKSIKEINDMLNNEQSVRKVLKKFCK